jgi:hypothetical protein
VGGKGGDGGRREKWPKHCMHIWIIKQLKKKDFVGRVFNSVLHLVDDIVCGFYETGKECTDWLPRLLAFLWVLVDIALCSNEKTKLNIIQIFLNEIKIYFLEVNIL